MNAVVVDGFPLLSSFSMITFQGRLFARLCSGGSRRAIRAIAPPKTYESNFIHHDFLQFKKQHSQNKAILSFIVL